MSPASREDVAFAVDGETVAAWLYRPDGAAEGGGCVVLGHGFGALEEARLDAYAERFADAGFAALVFDYRHFGASTGEPRDVLDIGRQHADWRAAIAYARELDGVDAERVALWGSSFSGAHVIAVGADDERITAIVSQVPHAEGVATMRAGGLVKGARLTAAGLVDALWAVLGRDPHYVPIVGPPRSLAAMTTPDAEPGYSGLYPDGFEWRNEVAARIALQVLAYSPGRRAGELGCPLLVQVGTRDVIAPPEPARRAAEQAPRGEVREYDIGHFDIYVGEAFERAVADQVDFLRRHLA
jgi:uncharacterized protein